MATSGAGKPYALKSQIGLDLERLVQLPSITADPVPSTRDWGGSTTEWDIGVGRLIDQISDDLTR